ncbi:MAG: hypothetical protein MZU79_02145 [Anaerotruncus sp.]|nr:hypothetical protein [Anaerotruncus sp.]
MEIIPLFSEIRQCILLSMMLGQLIPNQMPILLGIEITTGWLHAFIADGKMLLSTKRSLSTSKVINRSTINGHDVYLGLWADFDLGFCADDMVGSDSARSMFFCL